MAAPYVTADLILAHVAGSGTPSTDPADEDWAELCAAAIEAIISDRLDGTTPSAGFEARIIPAAIQDGSALFISRSSPHGVLNIGPDGDIVRLGSAQSRALDNVFLPGIG